MVTRVPEHLRSQPYLNPMDWPISKLLIYRSTGLPVFLKDFGSEPKAGCHPGSVP